MIKFIFNTVEKTWILLGKISALSFTSRWTKCILGIGEVIAL